MIHRLHLLLIRTKKGGNWKWQNGWATYNYGKQIRVCGRVSYICLGVMMPETFSFPRDGKNNGFPCSCRWGRRLSSAPCLHKFGWASGQQASLECSSQLQSFQPLKQKSLKSWFLGGVENRTGRWGVREDSCLNINSYVCKELFEPCQFLDKGDNLEKPRPINF